MPRAALSKRPKHPLAVAKGGRPAIIKATPELVARACARITKGLPIESALNLEGISRQAMDKWRAKNPSVQIAFQRAETQFEEDMVALLRGHAIKDGKIGQWLLERRTRASWLPPATKTELTGKDGGAIQAMTISKILLSNVSQSPDALKDMKVAQPV
jgi:hypothetical protein